MVKISAMVLIGDMNEPYINYCIDSIIDIVDEIIIIKPRGFICSLFKDSLKVKEFIQETEKTDFASWRNQALQHCTGDYVLWLDSDELLAKPDGSPVTRELLEQIIKNNKDAYHIFTFHFMYDYRTLDGRNDGIHHSQCRLFKNENVRFEGKIHEYIVKEQNYKPEHSGLNKDVKIWSRPESFGIVNNPCIWHYGHCKGMEHIREKYSRTRNIEGNPFAMEHKKFKDNDEYCANHSIFRKSRPLIQYDGPHPKCLKLW